MIKKQRHPVTGCRVDTLLNDLWLANADVVQSWVDMAFSFDFKDLVVMAGEKRDKDKDEEDNVGYDVRKGVAVMHVRGGITKYPTSFGPVMGGTSCIGMVNALDHAAENKDVKAIVIQGESPGGTADGLARVAKRIRTIDAAVKPVFGFADDVSTSAMYWILSATRYIGANENALVGSIGGMTILRDSSEAFKREGIKVIPITTGTLKGTGAPGVELTDKEIAYVKNLVTQRVQPFYKSVADGRKLTTEELNPIIQTAETFTAVKGKELKLVDTIADLDDYIDRVRSETVNTTTVSIPGPSSQPENVPNKLAANAGRLPMELSAAQLATIRSVCGDSSIDNTNALDRLLSRASAMHTETANLTAENTRLNGLIPKKIDAGVLADRVTTKSERIDLMLESGKITQAQCDRLKTLVTSHSEIMVGTNVSGKPVIDAIMETLTLGANSGVSNGAQTDAQEQPFKPNGTTNLDQQVEAGISSFIAGRNKEYTNFGADLTPQHSVIGSK